MDVSHHFENQEAFDVTATRQEFEHLEPLLRVRLLGADSKDNHGIPNDIMSFVVSYPQARRLKECLDIWLDDQGEPKSLLQNPLEASGEGSSKLS